MNAFVEISETTEVAVAWFVQFRGGDIMAIVYRDSATAPWGALIRKRMYRDEEIFSSEDEKEGFRVPGEPTDASRDHLVERMEEVIATMALALDGRTTRLPVNGSGEDFARLYIQLPFVHAKAVAQEPGRPQ